MAELQAISPCAGLLPVTVGAVTLKEVNPGHLTTIAPFAGQHEALSAAMQTAHGVRFPDPNTTEKAGAVQAFWFGRDMTLLVGPAPDTRLAGHAALTDQSDAWAAVSLEGSSAQEVLARLVPVDLRATSFTPGQTCRTLLGHMTASITRSAPDAFLILVFRSMAATLVDEVQEAMEAVAARG